jgi:hypothetical protein
MQRSILHPTDSKKTPYFVDINPDTGNEGVVYINEDVAIWLSKNGASRLDCSGRKVCSGLGSGRQFCLKSSDKFKFKFQIYNDLIGGPEV